MRTRIRGNGDNSAGAIRYVSIRLFVFLVIAGFGIGLMYWAVSCCLIIAVGVVYVIVECAIIIVMLADQFDREVFKKLRGKA